MPEPAPAPTGPQFGTAEYADKDVCKLCHQRITKEYFRVNSAMACRACAEKAQLGPAPDLHRAFVGAALLGVGGAVLGLIIYSGFAIITGWMIGYVALAVGYIVGKAIMKGSGGVNGRR